VRSYFSKPDFKVGMKSILATALSVTLFTGIAAGQSSGPVSKKGVLDATAWNFNEHQLALTGEWILFEDQLIGPNDSIGKSIIANFPKTWNETKGSRNGTGFATYLVSVLVPKDIQSFALEIPQIYSSYELWVNGKSVAANGKPGTTEEETIPQWKPQTVLLQSPGTTLDIILQIANFHHNKGGSKDPVYLGTAEMLQQKRSLSVWSNMAEALLLTLTGLGFLFIYWGSDKKRITAYFALLCLTWAVRSVFSNLYLFISLVPDFNWNVMIRIEYVTLFLSLIWAMLFTYRLFPNESSNALKYLLVGINILYILFALFTKPLQFTQYLPVYLFTCGFVLLYCVVIVIRAWVNERVGVLFLIISLLLGVTIFAYDLFAYEGLFVYNSVVFSIGYVIVFLLMAPALLLHLKIITSKAKPSNILTYKDLYGEGNSK
jgi:7TM diverse intracellular signalling